MIGSVGPNVSSVMHSIEWSTSSSTVGSQKRPAPSRALPPTATVAPFSTASSTWDFTISDCLANVTAPTSTLPGSVGTPWRSADTFSVTSPTNSS